MSLVAMNGAKQIMVSSGVYIWDQIWVKSTSFLKDEIHSEPDYKWRGKAKGKSRFLMDYMMPPNSCQSALHEFQHRIFTLENKRIWI
jgi:hypothetical protein